jgi:hypothetical protein
MWILFTLFISSHHYMSNPVNNSDTKAIKKEIQIELFKYLILIEFKEYLKLCKKKVFETFFFTTKWIFIKMF